MMKLAHVATFLAGVAVTILSGAAATRPAPAQVYPRYQVSPWGNSDTLIVVDNATNHAHLLVQEYNEKDQISAPWRSMGKFSLDEATQNESERFEQGVLRPHITTRWRN